MTDTAADTTRSKGWARPAQCRKWHYFKGATSLCRKWMFLGQSHEEGNDDSPDNCLACRRAKAKEETA